jgi:hypothetical protein
MSANRWRRALAAGGRAALASKGVAGAKCSLVADDGLFQPSLGSTAMYYDVLRTIEVKAQPEDLVLLLTCVTACLEVCSLLGMRPKDSVDNTVLAIEGQWVPPPERLSSW